MVSFPVIYSLFNQLAVNTKYRKIFASKGKVHTLVIFADFSVFSANISPYVPQVDKTNNIFPLIILSRKCHLNEKVVPDFRHGENIYCDRKIFLT